MYIHNNSLEFKGHWIRYLSMGSCRLCCRESQIQSALRHFARLPGGTWRAYRFVLTLYTL